MSKEAMELALEALEVFATSYSDGNAAITALREALAEQPAQENTYGYAKRLAEAIFKQHFASDEHYASGRIVWGVHDTVIGILMQIDNMAADMVRRPAQRTALPDAITDDSESPEYRTGWNECREVMKGMMK
jgi:hypothetical protein